MIPEHVDGIVQPFFHPSIGLLFKNKKEIVNVNNEKIPHDDFSLERESPKLVLERTKVKQNTHHSKSHTQINIF